MARVYPQKYETVADQARNLNRVKYRISKGHGRIMIIVALAFDLLPMILMLFAIGYVFSTLGGSSIAKYEVQRAIEHCSAAASAPTDTYWQRVQQRYHQTECDNVKFLAGLATGGIVGAALMFAPVFFLMGIALSVGIGFPLFVCWFAIKGVFVFSPTPKSILTNLTTLVLKIMPIVNVIVPSITVATWRHVRTAQKEDEEKHRAKMAAKKSSRSRLAARTPFRRAPVYVRNTYPQIA